MAEYVPSASPQHMRYGTIRLVALFCHILEEVLFHTTIRNKTFSMVTTIFLCFHNSWPRWAGDEEDDGGDEHQHVP